MKVSPPPKFESCRYDKKAELRFRLLTSAVGWGFFKGADGNIYFTYTPQTKGTNPTHLLDVRMQRWYACYECGLCFLGQKYVSTTMFSTHDQEILGRKNKHWSWIQRQGYRRACIRIAPPDT